MRRRSREITTPDPFDLDAYDASQTIYGRTSSKYQSVSLHDYSVEPYSSNPFPFAPPWTTGINSSSNVPPVAADNLSPGATYFMSDWKEHAQLTADSLGVRRSVGFTQDQIVSQGVWSPQELFPRRVSGDVSSNSLAGGWGGRVGGRDGNAISGRTGENPPAYGYDKSGVRRWSTR